MTITVEDSGSVRTITINRPARRNALDPITFAALGAAFVAAEEDDSVRVVILTGTGDQAFCAGMDLKSFDERGGSSGPAASTPGTAGAAGTAGTAGATTGTAAATGTVGTEVFVERVYPKPIIAAVNGAAVGGGFGIALGCDLVVAAEHAVFGLPEVQRGLVGAGAGSRAAMRLPPAVALELILIGEPIDAHRAQSLGLVNRVVPKHELLDTARGLAERIAANGPLAVRVSKEIVYDVRRLIDGVDIAALRAKAAPVLRSEDAREGARAFAEKRTPNYVGR